MMTLGDLSIMCCWEPDTRWISAVTDFWRLNWLGSLNCWTVIRGSAQDSAAPSLDYILLAQPPRVPSGLCFISLPVPTSHPRNLPPTLLVTGRTAYDRRT